MRSIKSAPVVPQIQPDAKPSLPPRLPSRPVKPPPQLNDQPQSPAPVQPRRLPPPPSSGFTKHNSFADNRQPAPASPDAPPPVPISSRPSATQIDAVVTRAAASAVVSCLVCRDFSRPDAIAAQFPAHTLPRQDPVGYLANVLCGSFPSATDKARAIFTWCHHNIAYNVEEFFGKCIKHRSVEDTIFHGKAVCQGYAEVYQSIAQRAGLQCVLVSGHGKGFSHSELKKGERPPPEASNHAWNAVMIDNGEWKLLDACWGAGHLDAGNTYKQKFSPQMFYFSNEMFGLTHFPTDRRHFYRADGSTQTWEEYYIGPVAGGQASTSSEMEQEGLSPFNFLPAEQQIPVYGGPEIVRFQFSKVCEHWDGVKHGSGPPYLLMVKIGGLDGRKDDFVPLDTDGYWYWCDIRARDLGAPGQKIFLYSLTSLNNKDARGVTKDEFLRAKGRSAMGWSQYVSWDLV